MGKRWELGEGVRELFERYDWPGNVRQLVNALERCKVLADDSRTISIGDLPPELKTGTATAVPTIGGKTALDAISRAHVLSVLDQHNGNKTQAARALGIDRRALYRLLEKYL